MSIPNQLTMVQLTIDNAKMQIQSPKSNITNRQARPLVPSVPSVPFVAFAPDVRGVSVVRDVSNVRGVSVVRGVSANAQYPKKTEHQEMRNSDPNVVSEARASARAYLRVRSAKPSTTPSAEAAPTPPYQGGELSESGILESRDSKLDRVSCVSRVSSVSGVSFLSSVSTVSDAYTPGKK